MRKWPVIAALLTLFFLPEAALAAAQPGDLIKLANGAAVYYLGQDHRRYVFPDAKTYQSWYDDFSAVKTIGVDEMAALQIGGNVTHRPGVRMVKIQTDPKTYAVDRGGTLRWVADEAIAARLYGPGWSKKIDDVPDAFFANYKLGAPITDASSYDPASAAATPDISADKMLTTAPPSNFGPPSLTVELPSDAKSRVLIQGAQNAALASFVFRAGSAPVTVTSAAFRSYIDLQEGGFVGFHAGSDTKNQMTTYVRDHFPSAVLYDASGTLLAGPAPIDPSGRAAFHGFSLVVPAGESRVVTLKGDLSRNVDLGLNPDLVAFDVDDAGRDVAAHDAAGAIVSASGTKLNGGDKPAIILTLKSHGAVDFAWSGAVGTAIAGNAATLGSLAIAAHDDDYDLKTLSFIVIGQIHSLSALHLQVSKADGTFETFTAPYANNVTFSGLSIHLPRDRTTTLVLSGAVPTRERGADHDDEIRVDFSQAAPMELAAESTGDRYHETQFGSYGLTSSSFRSDLQVLYTTLAAARTLDSPSGDLPRDQSSPVLKFSFAADPAGAARLQHLAFKLTPGDAGTRGTPNDALENWANLNGNFYSATKVAKLRSSVDGYGTIIGQDTTVFIRYSIVHYGVKNTSPSSIESAQGDYGLIEYLFGDGHEFVIPAGQTVTFLLALDTVQFAPAPHNLDVQMLGGADFAWIDTGTGFYNTTYSGASIRGLPTPISTLTVL